MKRTHTIDCGSTIEFIHQFLNFNAFFICKTSFVLVLLAVLFPAAGRADSFTGTITYYPGPSGSDVVSLSGPSFGFSDNGDLLSPSNFAAPGTVSINSDLIQSPGCGLSMGGSLVATCITESYTHFVLDLDSAVSIPSTSSPAFASGTLTLPATATLSGQFDVYGSGGLEYSVLLSGVGTGTMRFSDAGSAPGHAVLDEAQFDVTGVETAVPEPGTLLLLGSGLLGLTGRIRRKMAR
jgi:hypothetical protein